MSDERNKNNLSYRIKNFLEKIDLKEITNAISILFYIIIMLSAFHCWQKFYIYGIHFDFFVYDINFLVSRIIYYFKISSILFIIYISAYLEEGFNDFIHKIIILVILIIFLGVNFSKNEYAIVNKILLFLIHLFSLILFIIFLDNLFSKKSLENKLKNFKILIILSSILFAVPELSYLLQLPFVKKVQYSIINSENQGEQGDKQKQQEDKIILFKAGDKIFLSDFEIDDKGTKDDITDDVCTIYTKNYEIRKYEDIKVENRIFSDVIVDKKHTKEEAKEQSTKATTKTSTETTEKTTKEIKKEVIKNE